MLRRRASAVIIKDDRILMVKISDKGRSWWCLPGGTIEPNETLEEAIARELCEELNLRRVEPRERLYEAPIPYETGVDFGIVIDPPTDVPLLGIDPAVTDWAWRPLDEADDSWQVAEVKKALASKA